MLNYYQPFLWPFLRKQRYTLPPDVAQRYYHSAEDALWDILKNKQIPKGRCVLIPSFYCVDVIQNIEAHGYPVQLYEVDEQFQTSARALFAAVAEHQPVVVVLFHAAGIQSQPFSGDLYERIQQIIPGCLFIEDNVHRLTDPERVELFGEFHLILDSLRKDSPLPGGFVYAKPAFFDFPLPVQYNWHWYRWVGLFWFLLFRATFVMAVLLRWPRLVEFAHDVVLKKHDDLIGDVDTPPLGFAPFQALHRWFDFAKVRALKVRQAALYERALQPHFASLKQLYPIHMTAADREQLHVYPVGVRWPAESGAMKRLLQQLHKHGVVIWAKFPDSPWSKQRSVLFFPLGFHVSDAEIDEAVRHLRDAITNST